MNRKFGSFYWQISPRLSVADREPSMMETEVANRLLRQSVADARKSSPVGLGNPSAPGQDYLGVLRSTARVGSGTQEQSWSDGFRVARSAE